MLSDADSCDLFLLAGEPSGDVHGAEIMRALRKRAPGIRITGVGGPLMEGEGLRLVADIEELSVAGVTDIASALPRLVALFRRVKKRIIRLAPKGILFIDCPEFNLRMARGVKKSGIPTRLFHFVCPSVWAWRRKRIVFMEKYLDELFAILPFEPDLFEGKRPDVRYVGHPLVTKIASHPYDAHWRRGYGIGERERLLALFPGSRPQEWQRNAPLQLRVARRIVRRNPELRLVVSASSDAALRFAERVGVPSNAIIPRRHLYELMREAHAAVAVCGTVTLELALHAVPTVVTYGVAPFDWFLARKVFRVDLPYYCLPNLILREEMFPELIGPRLRAESLFDRLIDTVEREEIGPLCKARSVRLKECIGPSDASEQVAERIVRVL
ncbi:MAG: lipid-A-disaccharide synthase [Simkaniaceae bacterium]|nr:lipid-A-disaccharide synthase [Simkaniaceae bacterium]